MSKLLRFFSLGITTMTVLLSSAGFAAGRAAVPQEDECIICDDSDPKYDLCVECRDNPFADYNQCQCLKDPFYSSDCMGFGS
jgi:hypothetical protein